MNDTNPTPQPAPPQIPPVTPPSAHGPRPLGDDPAERVPISNAIAAIEAMLRQPRRLMHQLRQPDAGKLVAGMLFMAVLCSLIYGVVVGSFSGGDQWWPAPVKISIGLLI